jgi:hypothetical protein
MLVQIRSVQWLRCAGAQLRAEANMTDIYDTLDFGYDVPEDIPVKPLPKPAAAAPPSATVDANLLPPVGKQTTPSCFVWSTVYGLTTFQAAKTYNLDPTSADNQASPIYTYIKVEEDYYGLKNACQGGQMAKPLLFLNKNGGTASMTDAPSVDGCSAAWAAWGTATTTPNANFDFDNWTGVTVNGDDGIANIQNLISQNMPIAFGCWLYTGFPQYTGNPVPYVGSGVWMKNPRNGGKVGHCMLIIGYDTTMGPNGAILVQNSFGTSWGSSWNGSDGYVWIDCATFLAMAQGGGYYYP